MARVTIEDCLEHVPDHFALIHLTAKRYRQLHKNNSKPLVESKNKPIVTALREIAAGKVTFREDVERTMRDQSQEVNERRSRSQRLDAIVQAGKLNPNEQ